MTNQNIFVYDSADHQGRIGREEILSNIPNGYIGFGYTNEDTRSSVYRDNSKYTEFGINIPESIKEEFRNILSEKIKTKGNWSFALISKKEEDLERYLTKKFIPERVKVSGTLGSGMARQMDFKSPFLKKTKTYTSRRYVEITYKVTNAGRLYLLNSRYSNVEHYLRVSNALFVQALNKSNEWIDFRFIK